MAATEEEKRNRYVMPRPKIGQFVNWHPGGDKRNPHRAIVKEVYDNKILCFDTVGGQYPHKTCFHASDPEVAQKEKAVKAGDGGTWDFTEEEANAAKRQQAIDDRFAALEAKLDAKINEVLALVTAPPSKK